jgi:hypothetical protein
MGLRSYFTMGESYNRIMRKRFFPLAALVVSALLLAVAGLLPAAETTKLTIKVHTPGGHPIDRAEVIVRWHANKKHPAARFNRAMNTTYEMRTDQEGLAVIPPIPQGSILVQVNAKGYQTFGHVFDIDDEEKTIDIPLNPPQQQYTAH